MISLELEELLCSQHDRFLQYLRDSYVTGNHKKSGGYKPEEVQQYLDWFIFKWMENDWNIDNSDLTSSNGIIRIRAKQVRDTLKEAEKRNVNTGSKL